MLVEGLALPQQAKASLLAAGSVTVGAIDSQAAASACLQAIICKAVLEAHFSVSSGGRWTGDAAMRVP